MPIYCPHTSVSVSLVQYFPTFFSNLPLLLIGSLHLISPFIVICFSDLLQRSVLQHLSSLILHDILNIFIQKQAFPLVPVSLSFHYSLFRIHTHTFRIRIHIFRIHIHTQKDQLQLLRLCGFTISLLIVQHSHPYTRTPKTTMLPVLSLFNYSLFSLYIHTFSIYIHTFNIHILYIQHSHPYARTKKPTSLPAASSPFQYS